MASSSKEFSKQEVSTESGLEPRVLLELVDKGDIAVTTLNDPELGNPELTMCVELIAAKSQLARQAEAGESEPKTKVACKCVHFFRRLRLYAGGLSARVGGTETWRTGHPQDCWFAPVQEDAEGGRQSWRPGYCPRLACSASLPVYHGRRHGGGFPLSASTPSWIQFSRSRNQVHSIGVSRYSIRSRCAADGEYASLDGAWRFSSLFVFRKRCFGLELGEGYTVRPRPEGRDYKSGF